MEIMIVGPRGRLGCVPGDSVEKSGTQLVVKPCRGATATEQNTMEGRQKFPSQIKDKLMPKPLSKLDQA